MVPHMPALLTKSVPWSYRFKRDLLPIESLLVQGVPVMKECLPPRYREIYWCPFESLLSEHLHGASSGLQQERLSDNEIRSLSGNGMAFVVVGTAFVLGMASFEKTPEAQPAPELAEAEEMELASLASSELESVDGLGEQL